MEAMAFCNGVRTRDVVGLYRRIRNGADPRELKYVGLTPLQCAIEVPDAHMVAWLLQFGCDPATKICKGGGETCHERVTKVAKAKDATAEQKLVLAAFDDKAERKRLCDELGKELEEKMAVTRGRFFRDVAGAMVVMAIGLGCLAFGSLHMAKKGFLKDEEVERKQRGCVRFSGMGAWRGPKAYLLGQWRAFRCGVAVGGVDVYSELLGVTRFLRVFLCAFVCFLCIFHRFLRVFLCVCNCFSIVIATLVAIRL